MEKLRLRLDRTSGSKQSVDGLIASNYSRLALVGDQELQGPLEGLENLMLSELRRGVFSLDSYVSGGMHEARVAFLSGDSREVEEDPDSVPYPQVTFEVLPDRVHVVCTTVSKEPFDSYSEIGERLWPLLKRENLFLLELQVDDSRSASVGYLTAEVRGRGRTVKHALDSANKMVALWEATIHGDLDLAHCQDLIDAGQPDLLLGLPESQWLEVKGEPYRLDEPEQRFELAKDVAAMANGGGGLIVLGIGTKKEDGRDILASVRPIPEDLVNIDRYRKLIFAHVYPAPTGLAIERVNLGQERSLVSISVPSQPAGALPLLTIGSVKGKRLHGNRVTIVERSGSESLVFEPAAVHGLIAVGRAVQQVLDSGDFLPEMSLKE